MEFLTLADFFLSFSDRLCYHFLGPHPLKLHLKRKKASVWLSDKKATHNEFFPRVQSIQIDGDQNLFPCSKNRKNRQKNEEADDEDFSTAKKTQNGTEKWHTIWKPQLHWFLCKNSALENIQYGSNLDISLNVSLTDSAKSILRSHVSDNPVLTRII